MPSRNEFNLAAAKTLPATWKHDDDQCPDDFQPHAVTEQEVGKVIKDISLNKENGRGRSCVKVRLF